MENIKGWLVLAFTKDKKQVWATLDVKGLAAGNRAINTIPILTKQQDASLIASHCWEQNDNIEHIAIVDVASLFEKNKPNMRLISEKAPKKIKKWYQFWR